MRTAPNAVTVDMTLIRSAYTPDISKCVKAIR